jgi:hypothetical protein
LDNRKGLATLEAKDMNDIQIGRTGTIMGGDLRDWVENKADLEGYFRESGWLVEWAD